jgi:nucleoporin p58/p45
VLLTLCCTSAISFFTDDIHSNMKRSAITFMPGALTIAPPCSGANTTATNTQQSQPASTSLFGAAPAATSQPQQSAGLFGSSTTTSQPQQSTGLFGAAPAAAQPAKPTLSLFGNNPANPSNTQPQQQQSGGLFGAATANNNTSNTGAMFGSTAQNSTQTQNKPSLFGAPAATPGLLYVRFPNHSIHAIF